jgi:hypothetical protein
VTASTPVGIDTPTCCHSSWLSLLLLLLLLFLLMPLVITVRSGSTTRLVSPLPVLALRALGTDFLSGVSGARINSDLPIDFELEVTSICACLRYRWYPGDPKPESYACLLVRPKVVWVVALVERVLPPKEFECSPHDSVVSVPLHSVHTNVRKWSVASHSLRHGHESL